ncbi:MAG: M28 family peptidase [Oscillospiraceae bacterium]
MNNRLSVGALDDRCGVAALLRTAEILSGEKPDARVTVLFSAQEETGGSGVTTAAYQIYLQEAIMVDVSFAKQLGCLGHSGGAGKGPDDRRVSGTESKGDRAVV